MIGGLQVENGDLNNIYLKKKSKSVGRKYLEALKRISQACKMAVKFCKLKVSISQPKVDFAAILLWFRSLQNWPSAWYDWLPMAITSSFQLRFMNCFKCWIANFSSFETIYSMNEMDSGSAPKVSNSCCPLEFFMLDFSLCFPSLHSWFAYGKGL